MRIISGQWRGRPLVAPKGELTRPTADRTRETLFSMLVSRIGSFEGLRVADLYAGSGALALEALSRGAATALLIENDRAALTAIEANAARLGAAGAIAAVTAIAEHQLGKGKSQSSSRMVKSAGKAAAAAMGKKLMGNFGDITSAAADAAKKA